MVMINEKNKTVERKRKKEKEMKGEEGREIERKIWLEINWNKQKKMIFIEYKRIKS